jgi:hypothetical protein
MTALARLVVALAMAVAPALAQTQKAAPVSRIDGHPDLQGIWTNATITPLERTADKATVSDADARAVEKKAAEDLQNTDGASDTPLLRAAGSAGTGGYNILFIDRGSELTRVDGVKRTSLVIDPPDGKAPAMTPAGRARAFSSVAGTLTTFDNVKQRPLSERCLLAFGSSSGPPMLPVLYNNNYQIVQTPDAVIILVEMIHDARIVRMNGQHPSADVKLWMGDSIGRWDGDTLVVDTTNFRDEVAFRGAGPKFHVVERFRRVDANTMLYRATMEDPDTWTKPWTIEYSFNAVAGPIYEYACHEGNYAMTDILGGARKMESVPTKK